MRKVILLFLLFLSVAGVRTQGQNITFSHLTTDDGLSQFSVNSLYIDERGIIWIGTRDCAGVCNGSAVEDCAGVCGGSAKLDCAGVCDGGHYSTTLCGCCARGETCYGSGACCPPGYATYGGNPVCLPDRDLM